MKKVLFLFVICFIFSPIILADEIESTPKRIDAEIVNCDSISNVWLSINGEIKRIHLLAFEVDSGTLDEKIDEYFCSLLNNGTNIQVEYDLETKDKYNRELVYLYVNAVSVQKNLLSKGYGQVNNVEGDYKYLDEFCNIQKEAIISKAGIWNYPNIEEKYCNSGIEIGSNKTFEEEEKLETKDYSKTLKFMLLINSGILILVIIIKMNNKKSTSN